MSHLSEVIVIVIDPSKIHHIFDIVHQVLGDNHLEIDTDFNTIVLSDIDTNDGEDYLYESQTFEPSSRKEWDEKIELLKSHRTGGLINYRGCKDNFSVLPPYDIGVEFCSLDNQTIEYIIITTRDYIYEPHKKTFNDILISIMGNIKVKGIVKGLDYPYEWSEEEVAEHIRDGKWENVPSRLVYKIENKSL